MHRPAKRLDLEGAIESGGRGREHRAHGDRVIIAGAGRWGTTAFHGHQQITLSNGQEIVIRIMVR